MFQRATRRNEGKRKHANLAAAVGIALLAGVTASTSACRRVEPSLTVRDFDPADIRMHVEVVGRLDAKELTARKFKGDIDGTARLPINSCPGGCAFAVFTVYIDNTGADPVAPPVLRLDVPERRPPRQPVAFRAAEISPHRTGRIRWLVELWPEEETLDAHLTSSVFLQVAEPAASNPSSSTAAPGGRETKDSPAGTTAPATTSRSKSK